MKSCDTDRALREFTVNLTIFIGMGTRPRSGNVVRMVRMGGGGGGGGWREGKTE